MRKSLVLASMVLLTTYPTFLVADVEFRPGETRWPSAPERYHLSAGQRVRELGRAGDIVATTTTAENLAWGRRVFQREGGGANIVDLIAAQVAYLDSTCTPPAGCDPSCNAVTLVWDETVLNVLGIDVFIDNSSTPLTTLAGAPADVLPVTASLTITGLSAGPHTFELREKVPDGTPAAAVATVSMVVVDTQPFDNPTGQCVSSERSIDGSCLLTVNVQNESPPDTYDVFFNGRFIDTFSSDDPETPIGRATPGQYGVGFVGELVTQDGTYRGCPTTIVCDFQCVRTEACQAPVSLTILQDLYGTEDGGNGLRAGWVNSEAPYTGGVQTFINGDPGPFAPPDAEGANPTVLILSDLAAGPFTVGVQGDCGVDGTSTVSELTHEVLSESPFTNPIVAGSLSCEFVPEDQTIVTWTNDEPSDFIWIFIEVDGTRSFLGTGSPTTNQVTVTGTDSDDVVILQFFRGSGGNFYGSELIRCDPSMTGPRFVRGLCDGSAAGGDVTTMTITSATFLLNFLFQGGLAPVCREACDADGSGVVNITDATFVLNFLFLAGVPPAGWVPRPGDGVFEPTCQTANPGADCEAGHEACAN